MIAILGATGYVGRSLAAFFAAHDRRRLVLFARQPSDLAGDVWPERVAVAPLASFGAGRFDLVINSIGAGDPARVAQIGPQILDITAFWDRRVLDTMRQDTRYVFLSSGAIYGAGFDAAVDADSRLSIPVNALDRLPAYVLAKLIAEFGHCQMPERHILDLRIFGHADPSFPDNSTFFLADLARSARCRDPFVTHPGDFVRDYTGAAEIHALISAWETAGAPRGPADVYSLAPISKYALLEEARLRFDLDIRWNGEAGVATAGPKPIYASQFRSAAGFGYAPWRTALDVAMATLDAIARAP